MRIALFLLLGLLSFSVFAVPAPNDVVIVNPSPIPVSLTFPNPLPVSISTLPPAPVVPLQTGAVSDFVKNVTLGDIWLLQLILGFIQCIYLGLIHGHQR